MGIAINWAKTSSALFHRARPSTKKRIFFPKNAQYKCHICLATKLFWDKRGSVPTGTHPQARGRRAALGQYLLDAGLLPDDRPLVLVAQPRRLAAVNLARRVAQERGQPVGGEVGYQVRFESCCGPGRPGGRRLGVKPVGGGGEGSPR